MKINKDLNGKTLTFAVEGRLDTNSSPKLEKEIMALDGVEELIIDLKGLEFISSAGLRVLLYGQKLAIRQGYTMIIRNASEEVKDIFEITGFIDLVNLE